MHLLRGIHNASLTEVCSGSALEQVTSPVGCVATIGNFDGVHQGHQRIIQRVQEEAAARGLPSLVIVFEPQPMEYFKGEDAPARLMRFRDKFEALRELGVDFLCCLSFNKSLSEYTAQKFVTDILVDHLSIKHIVVGDDFRFGGDREGDFELLSQLGSDLNFTVENTETITAGEQASPNARASSTLIRKLLKQGKFNDAESVLGRPFHIAGRVVHGEKLGRQIGFPTANIALRRKTLPFSGVYAVSLEVIVMQARRPNADAATQYSDAQPVAVSFNGVANIGKKPTVGEFKPNLEVHLFDFDQDIYGARVKVTFHHKLRDEKRFSGVDELVTQIAKDVDEAMQFFIDEKQC